MIKKYFVLSSLSLFIFISFVFISASADGDNGEKKVVSAGVADGNTAMSRDEALNNALRNAVEQGIGTYVTSKTIVEQMTVLEDRIYSESSGYISSYKIISSGVKNELYEVKISAVVRMDKLARDLRAIGLLINKKQNPRVMVILYSKKTGSSFFDIVEEGNLNALNLIESIFMEKGFKLVDAGQIRHKKKLEAFLLSGKFQMAGKLAKDFGAEVLIEGEVKRTFLYSKKLYGRSMDFFTNDIRLKALETDTCKILFSGYKTRPPSGSAAMLPMEEAVEELTDEMIEGILMQWKKDVFQAGTYEINLAGASFNDLTNFKEALKIIRGMKNINTRTFQSGIAQLEVEYQGTLNGLVEKISNIKTPLIEVSDFQANTIGIKIVK